MNNNFSNPFSRFLRSIFVAFIGLSFSLVLFSCKDKTPVFPDDSFTKYVESYTGGMINSYSSIRIEFVKTPDTSVAPEKLFSFSPSIKGEARWLGSNAIEFVPEAGALKSGKSYSAEFALGKVFKIEEKSHRKFKFEFNVLPKQAVLELSNVVVSSDNPKIASIKGVVRFSEAVDATTAESCLWVESADKDSQITILKDEGTAADISFIISPIARSDRDRAITVGFNGKKIGYLGADPLEITVPAISKFRVLSAKLLQSDEPCIEIQFTEPLENVADRNGLYQVYGATSSYSKIEDNILRIYYDGKNEQSLSVQVFDHIRSASGERLGDNFSASFQSSEIPPQLSLPISGNILPRSENMCIPFSAVNLSAVDVSVIQIFQDNVLTFLQENDFDGSYELRRSGRMILKKTIRLQSDKKINLREWNTFFLDLSALFKKEPAAIYRVNFSFKQEYSLYGNATESSLTTIQPQTIVLDSEGLSETEKAIWDVPRSYYYGNDFDWQNYDWRDRDNPLTPSYYMDSSRFPTLNVLSTEIGLTVKQANDNTIWVNVNNLMTAEPMAGVEIEAYNFQLRPIGSTKSDSDGFAQMKLQGKAFVVVAKDGKSTTYLKVNDGRQNSLSRFDTGGVAVEKGINAYVYGERGVWRPGDTLHLTLLVDAKAGLPENHPAKMEVYTPQGQLAATMTCNKSVNGFYCFELPTREDDPTGTWHAYFKIGGASFHKSLPIETIKPNRLKITLNTASDILEANKQYNMVLKSEWLSGPVAARLDAKTELYLHKGVNSFPSFPGYVFSNPLSDFTESSMEILSGKTDASGNLRQLVKMPSVKDAPGMLKATLLSRVTEPGGGESIVSCDMPFSAYSTYVGVHFPDESTLETDKDNEFSVAVVDRSGKRVSGRKIEYRIYKMDWNWWWENSPSRLVSFVNSSSAKLVASGKMRSGLGDLNIKFRVDYPDWGRYLLVVSDLDSGHSSGGVFFCDWPLWRGRAEREGRESSEVLSFTTDKKSYNVGDVATVYIPAAEGGMALLSFESADKVLSRKWVKTLPDSDMAYKFDITADMAPNCYLHISLFRPYKETAKAQVIRMYGVQPILVENPDSHLKPLLNLPEVIRPQQEFEVKVREASGKKMSYTLAVVDEGILSLTAFKTPDPWSKIYARQALGVGTWDMYSSVIGASARDMSTMFSIGGDEGGVIQGRNRDRRFQPVARFYGPFTLNKGERSHKICLPMYVGSVRVMLVAGANGAYGSASKTVPVHNPLMILQTSPRVVGTSEEFALPVNLFSMDEKLSDVKLSISVEGPAKIISEKTLSLHFDKPGDRLCRFRLKTDKAEGELKIKITASSTSCTVNESVSLQVRNPNPPLLKISRQTIAAGSSVDFDCPALVGENDRASLELASFPAFNTSGALSYVADYQHLCTEQLSSKAITALSLLPMLSSEDKKKVDSIVAETLRELALRQLPDGSFSFWPGSTTVNLWASTMVGHFMTLANANGYSVQKSIFNSWKNREIRTVKEYRRIAEKQWYDLQQAYSLYVLALSGSAELGAMNRLKSAEGLSSQTKWLLASAYALAGNKSTALQMTNQLSDSPDEVGDESIFTSSIRDKALILESLALTSQLEKALPIAELISKELDNYGFTTQTAAFATVAMSRLYPLMKNSAIDVEITSGAKTEKMVSAKSISSMPIANGGKLSVSNKSGGVVYASLLSRTVAPTDSQLPSSASGISLSVSYQDAAGNAIDPTSLAQGTDFYAYIKVSNTSPGRSMENLALSFRIASGWEIFNDRLYGLSEQENYSYRDIRDDRVNWYFSLPEGKSKQFSVRLTTAYEGEFTLPQIVCEAMYDNSIFATTASSRVVVKR